MSDWAKASLIIGAWLVLNGFAFWYDPLFTMIVLWKVGDALPIISDAQSIVQALLHALGR